MTEQKKEPLKTLILAAGKGSRMGSDLPKVLHQIGGRPILDYVVRLAREVGTEEVVVIVGHRGDLVREAFSGRGLVFMEQRELLGTGHAVLQARDAFEGYRGDVLILCGDVPFLPLETVRRFRHEHGASGAAVSVLTARMEEPRGYGRIVRDGAGVPKRIVEERDATDEEKNIREINAGIYLAKASFLFAAVHQIADDNTQKEYYLTDIVELANREGLVVHACVAEDSRSVMGINTPGELKEAEEYRLILEGRGRY
ncbi:MAG: NTP transferase domain-containing protein [Syntrophales bacterium]|jgi:UDP-N-acetylglucosamine diphosphorylase/glucosamine-1-phosphate N-acetyltransferase|nr:NTP transferase domain-containing protein [Syntrophales bacterium]